MPSRSDDPGDPLPSQRGMAELSRAEHENRLRNAAMMRRHYEWLDELRGNAEIYSRSGSFELLRSCESAIESVKEHLRQGVERYPEFADRELVERLTPVEKKWWERWPRSR